jgi:hypothetical protein
VARGQNGDDLLVKDHLRHQAPGVHRASQEANIDSSIAEGFDLVRRREAAERQYEIRVAFSQERQEMGEDCSFCSWDKSDRKAVSLGFRGLANERYRSIHAFKNGTSLGQKDAASLRQLNVVLIPTEQGSADVDLLQFLDLLAQRWLYGVQPLGGPREAALFSHCYEIAKISKIHDVNSSPE